MRRQYHFRPAEQGEHFDAWDVHRLIECSRGLPREHVSVVSISEIDTSYWTDGTGQSYTIRMIVEHVRLILAVDTQSPIILGWDGRVMDGMHRIARALLDGRAEIDAVRLLEPLTPDFRNVRFDEVPY